MSHPASRAAITARLTAAVLLAMPCVADAANFNDGNRWTTTATNAGPTARGDAVTITWSIMPDGSTMQDGAYKSNLVSRFDALYGVPVAERTADLTNRSWFASISGNLNRISELSGISYVYTVDDGAAFFTPGQLGVRGDTRIGMAPTPGALALGYSPNGAGGDVVISNSFDFTQTQLRGICGHEYCHTLGMGHVSSSRDVDTNAEVVNLVQGGGFNGNGPQFDDLSAIHRLYGDRLEKSGGNDTAPEAHVLGNIASGGARAIGTHAGALAITSAQTDFLSIDGASDADFFKVTVDHRSALNVTVAPKGPNYRVTPGGGAEQTIRAAEQSELLFDVYDGTQTRRLATIEAGTRGLQAAISGFRVERAGDYYIRVRGTQDANQFYRLDAAAASVQSVPHPTRIFEDAFAAPDSTDLNATRLSASRQLGGVVDSTYTTSTTGAAGNASVGIVGNALKLTGTSSGANNQASVDVARDFAAQVAGKIWNATFTLTMAPEAGVGDSWFSFNFADTNPVGGPFDAASEMNLLIRPSGAFQVKQNNGTVTGQSSVSGTGIAANVQHLVQLIVDETDGSPLMKVLIDGVVRLTNDVSLPQGGRFFNFRNHVGDTSTLGGLSSLISDFSINLGPYTNTTFSVASGNWTTGANWTGGAPGALGDAYINAGRAAQLNSAATAVGGNVYVGQGSGNGTLTVGNGASLNVAGAIALGRDAGRQGTYAQSGGTVTAGSFIVGDDGDLSAGGTSAASISGGTLNAGSVHVAIGAAGATTGSSFTQSGGTVNVATDVVLGNNGNAASLVLTGGTTNVAGNIAEGPSGVNASTITLDGGTLDLSGPSVNGSVTVDTLNLRSGTLRDVGQVNNGATLTKTGSNASSLVLDGLNTFTGNVTATNGSIVVRSSTALGTNAKTLTAANGTAGDSRVHLDGSAGNIVLPASVSLTTSNSAGAIFNDAGDNTINGVINLTGGGGATTVVVTTGTLTLANTIAPTQSGRVLQLSGPANGSVTGRITDGSVADRVLGVMKLGSGTWRLSDANTYTGPTTVSTGTLLVNNLTGSGTGTGAVSVAAGGTLGGTGAIGGAVTITGAGRVAPGDAGAGTLEINNALTLANGSGLIFDLATANVAGGSNGNDLLTSVGLTLGTNVSVAVQPMLPAFTTGVYVLLDYTGAVTNNSLNFSGWTVTGLPSGMVGSFAFGLDGATPSLNLLVATASTVPEPASFALVGIAGLLRLRRRHGTS